MSAIRELRERNDIEGRYAGKRTEPVRGLYLGNGPSVKKYTQLPLSWFEERYRVAVCVNQGWRAWTGYRSKRLEWIWLCPEEGHLEQDWYWGVPLWMLKFVSFANIPRIEERLRSEYSGVELDNWIDSYTGIRLSHNSWRMPVRAYGTGLQAGPPDKTGHLAGTVTCQALHLLSLMGCGVIDLVGCELGFKEGEPIHYYEDGYYPEQWAVKPSVMNTHWRSSADYISQYVIPRLRVNGVVVNVLCKSRITGDLT